MLRLTILATSDRNNSNHAWTRLKFTRPRAIAPAGPQRAARSRPPAARRRRRPSIPTPPIHKIAHLNDGRLGNGASWISCGCQGRDNHSRLARPRDVIDRAVQLAIATRSTATAWRPSITSRWGARARPVAGGRLRRSIASGITRIFRPQSPRTRPTTPRLKRSRRAGARAGQAASGQASCTTIATASDAQGLCRHVQPAGPNARLGTR